MCCCASDMCTVRLIQQGGLTESRVGLNCKRKERKKVRQRKNWAEGGTTGRLQTYMCWKSNNKVQPPGRTLNKLISHARYCYCYTTLSLNLHYTYTTLTLHLTTSEDYMTRTTVTSTTTTTAAAATATTAT